MAKPTSGGAGGSGGRQRQNVSTQAETQAAPPREFPFVSLGNEGAAATDYDNFLIPRFNDQFERMGGNADRIVEYESYSSPINKALRREKPLVGKVKRVTEVLDRAMHPLDEAIIVHRGAQIPEMFDLYNSGALVGAVVNDKGFMSTSINRGIANIYSGARGRKGIIIKLTIPKGKRVAYTDPTGRFSIQREIIIDRGSSIRVTRAQLIGGKLEVEGVVE